jgi:heme-degrading monooxygenase HmoA
MVTEVAEFDIITGREAEFRAAYGKGKLAFNGAPGCRSVRMIQGIESPQRFVLLIEWDSVQAHLDFRATPAFTQWRSHIADFFASPPHVEHFADFSDPV